MSGCPVCGKSAVGLRWNSRSESAFHRSLISDYERGRLRLNADMVVRLADALEVTADDLLHTERTATLGLPLASPACACCAVWRRSRNCRAHQQNTLLKTIDTFLRGATASR